jgi:hypothetical protein
VDLKRFSIALAFVLTITSCAEFALGCGLCGCCRVETSDDPISPYIYGDDPLATGMYEVGQSALAPGGTGSSIIPIDPGSWTLVVMPDTQHYSQTYPQHFNAQTQWIKDNAASQNIKYVLHEGDIVNTAAATAQWANSRTALDTLNGFVPYALAPGNHDYGGEGDNRTTYFDHQASDSDTNNYFGVGTPYASQPSIGGFYPGDGPGKTDNSYHTFSANGEDWIAFALEWGPRDAVVQWADQVLSSPAYSNHNAILVTHAYMYSDDTIYDWDTKGTSQNWNPRNPAQYGISNLPGGVNDGQDLWDNFVKKHDNFKFVFNGHVLNDGTGKRATLGDNGNVVHQILANYQMNVQGGQGDMRLLEFKADGETVVVRTYSPSLNRYNTAADQSFSLNMNTTDYTAYVPPPIGHAVVANLIAGGPTDPAGGANTVDSVTIPQASAPGVGTGQLNRGDYQVTIDGNNVTYKQGIMLASITQHDRPDFLNKRASVDIGRNSFGDGNLALSIMQTGQNNKEVNYNTSVAWFPFDSGFRGAHVDASGALATGAFNGVAPSMVTRTSVGRYAVNLGVNSLTDGMLFVTGNTNDNTVVQTCLNGANWDIRVTENNADLATASVDRDWSLLYLSYQTPGLIGGYYDGVANATLNSAGAFTMTRTATGQYQLTIPGQTAETGMLITSIANGTTVPDDNALSYQAGANGVFTINSYDLPGGAFENTKFVWAFISFANPITPYVIPGDYNRDALVDQFDYQTWRSQFGTSTGYLTADGNGDGVVDSADYIFWRKNLSPNGSAAGAATGVPEPCSITLVGAVCLGLSVSRFRFRRASRIFA